MKYNQRQSPGIILHWRWFLLGIIASLGLLMVLWYVLLADPTPTEVTSVAKPTAQPVTSRLLIVGDVFWGRSVQRKAEASGLGPAYLMSGVEAADRAEYDGWIANFECPVSYRDISYAQQLESLKFNCRPEYLNQLAKWFTAVSLANNHTNNNDGQTGLKETRTNLEAAGIQYTGSYDMAQTADICEIIAVPARVKGTQASRQIPIALCGYHYVVNVPPTDEQLMQMEQYARYMPVIALPHMGEEYRPTAEAPKVDAYRQMIDSGASVVIGAHPHVIQNSEVHRGKLIAYSIGNFMFDQQSLGRDTSVGLGLEMALTISDDALYRGLESTCRAHKDDCLQQLRARQITRPTIEVAYDFRCFDMAKGPPTAGSQTVCDQAKQRAGVADLQGLNDWL